MSSNDSTTTPDAEPAVLLEIAEVSALLRCSNRHVNRLAERGLMPPPIRLGALVRWNREKVETWISNGCPAIRTSREVSRASR